MSGFQDHPLEELRRERSERARTPRRADPPCTWVSSSKRRRSSRENGLTDDRELPLHRAPDDAVLPIADQVHALKHPGDRRATANKVRAAPRPVSFDR